MSSLESALRASALGIGSNGQAIAVVGDNISNSNTTAYKTSRAEFTDLMTKANGDRLSETVAGTGDGVSMNRVRVLFDPGVIESTGRELDVGISGGGFFLVGDAAAPEYTRAGAFEINADGNLTTSTGDIVLGFQGADSTNLGPINMYKVNTAGTPTSASALYGNLDAGADNTTVPAAVNSYRDLAQLQSYSASQDVYDSLGQRHPVQISFYKTANNTWEARAYIDGKDVQGGKEGVPVEVGQAKLTFSAQGVIVDADKGAAKMTVTPAWGNGAAAGGFTIDLSSFTQYAGGSLLNNVTQDGQASGSITSYQFDTDGKVYAVMDTGPRALVGSIPLAVFNNNDGLERSGSGTYQQTDAAGDAQVGAAGAGLRGTIEGQSLERSTVDIADQFVSLVVYQRAYQASSQVLSTAGKMIEGTLALIR